MKWLGLILIIVVGLGIGGVTGRAWLESTLESPLSLPAEGVTLEVRPGASLGEVLMQAANQGWLTAPKVVALWAKWKQLDRGLQVGEYRLEFGLTAKSLLKKLNAGDVIRYSVTFPEGITLADAVARLGASEGIEVTLVGPDDPRLIALVEPYAPEGWFLPETYQYTRGSRDLDVLQRANNLMKKVLTQAWQDRSIASPLKSPYEALILASIVERETSVAAERPLIAGVFARRLERGMRLQTDPTVIYGLGSSYDGNLTRKHLTDATNRWNTYRIPGLPPTPIALPGQEAIFAALNPEAGDALYFVAKGDGYHEFAATLEAHNANVRRFQYQRRTNYRSTPDKGVTQ